MKTAFHLLWLFGELMYAAAPQPHVKMLDFRADWCGPCRQMDPIVHKLQADGYEITTYNTDSHFDLVEKYHVDRIPCFITVYNGREVSRVVGATDKDCLERMLNATPPKSLPSIYKVNP